MSRVAARLRAIACAVLTALTLASCSRTGLPSIVRNESRVAAFKVPVPLGSCRYLTATIAKSAVPRAVNKVIDDTLPAKGLSLCFYGDEPNPKLLSLNSVDLDQVNATALRALGFSAQGYVHMVTHKTCAAQTVRTLGASSGIAAWGLICEAPLGPVLVGWTIGAESFVLTTTVFGDSRSVQDRFNDLEVTARAVVANM